MYKAFNEYRETSISSVETSFELSSSSLFHVLVAETNIILLVREGPGSKKKYQQPGSTTKNTLLRNTLKGTRTTRATNISISLGQENSLLFMGAKLDHHDHWEKIIVAPWCCFTNQTGEKIVRWRVAQNMRGSILKFSSSEPCPNFIRADDMARQREAENSEVEQNWKLTHPEL